MNGERYLNGEERGGCKALLFRGQYLDLRTKVQPKSPQIPTINTFPAQSSHQNKTHLALVPQPPTVFAFRFQDEQSTTSTSTTTI